MAPSPPTPSSPLKSSHQTDGRGDEDPLHHEGKRGGSRRVQFLTKTSPYWFQAMVRAGLGGGSGGRGPCAADREVIKGSGGAGQRMGKGSTDGGIGGDGR